MRSLRRLGKSHQNHLDAQQCASHSKNPDFPMASQVMEPSPATDPLSNTEPLLHGPAIRSCLLMAGSFDDQDVVHIYEHTRKIDDNDVKGNPRRSLSMPYLSKASAYTDNAESDDDDDESSITVDDDLTKNRTTVFRSTKPVPTTIALELMLLSLTDAEIEVAARTSYGYVQYSRSLAHNMDDPLQRKRQYQAAMDMASRHWIAERGDTECAILKMKRTLLKRHEADAIRSCFERDDEESIAIQSRIRHYLGPRGRMFVRGYDVEGRAIFHFISRNAPRNIDATLGCNESNCYILEKAIACTERRTGGRLSNVILCSDMTDFQKWQAPPFNCVKEMIEVLQNHYPERMHRIYIINAPRLFYVVWNLVKPFIDTETKAKVQFVAAMDDDVLEKRQAMPYQRKDGELKHPVKIEEFYSLPFQTAMDEVL